MAGWSSLTRGERLSGGDLVEEITAAQLALQHGRHGVVHEPLGLALDGRGQLQAQHRGQLAALQVAEHLEGIRRDRPRTKGPVDALRPLDPAAHGRIGVPLGFDRRAADQALRQLGSEPHFAEEMQLIPARHQRTRDLVGRCVERGKALGQQLEGGVGIGAPLAESVRQLHQVPGRRRRVQIVAQAEVRILQGSLGDDIEGAPHGQHQVNIAERLQGTADPGAGPANPLGNHAQLAETGGQHRQHPVGLPEIHAAQHDRLGLVETGAAHGRPSLGYPWQVDRRTVDIRTEFNDLLVEIEAEMLSVIGERDGRARPLYDMLTYHLGLDQSTGPRGKRMRPLLGLLAYESLGGDYRKTLPAAAAVELGHNFSLVHDDIEDADRERRHRPTLWAIWGVPLAINAGDALFALSRLALYRLMDDEEYEPQKLLDVMKVYDETCLALCEGQYLDISFERRTDVTVDEYMEMIAKKTAALISAAVETGAMMATDDPAVVAAYRDFGYDLGLAFQIADDLKGTFWTSAASGKPEAGDVRKRKKTLPLVWALEHGSEADRGRLISIYQPVIRATDGFAPAEADAPMTDVEVTEVLEILERSGARRHTEDEARRYRDEAVRQASALPVPQARIDQLRALVESVIAT